MIDRFQPLDDNVVIKLAEKKEDRDFTFNPTGMIVTTVGDKGPLTKGTVIAVGPGEYNRNGIRIPMTVKVGDEICYSNYQCTDLDRNHVLMKERQILGIIKGE